MPDWMATVGRWTPNGWALARVREMLFGEVDLAALGGGFAVLLGVGVALFLLSEQRLRRVFVRS
jgi:hypothetical protein